MARYRKKPIEIEAMQFKGPNIYGVDEMTAFDDWVDANRGDRLCFYRGEKFFIRTLEGVLEASPGDWIIRGTKGELYPCKPDIFADIYEPA